MSQKDFETMIAIDREVYNNLVKWRAFLNSGRKRLKSYEDGKKELFPSKQKATSFKHKIDNSEKEYNEVFGQYNERQNDYRTNSVYRIGQSITEFSDSVVEWSKSVWNNLTGGLSAAPLIVPIAIIAGSTITLVATAYFVAEYKTDTANSLSRTAKAVIELSETNPALANKMLEESARIGATQTRLRSESGVGTQIGKGLKTGIIIGVTAIAGIIGYNVYQDTRTNQKPKKNA